MNSLDSRSGGASLRRALTCFLLFCIFTSLLTAQDSPDPHETDLLNWDRAELPLPYGFVANAEFFVYGLEDDRADPIPSFGADFYYDAWQLGFHHEQWGNVFRLMTRTIGRDFVNYGFWIEYGWHSQDVYGPTLDEFGFPDGSELTGSESVGAFGAGFRYAAGYSSNFSATWGIEASGGSTHARLAMPLGLRLPIDEYVARLEVTPAIVGYSVGDDYDYGDSEFEGIFGIWVSTIFGMNFER